ncbi:phosphatase PAP2 family protein [Enterococcus xiangfangensis]|uniref:phosphatase PAP2 family protein n=1 Tax=Enterococcus xiangfangensis TaxID=1296537 RepID=UPI0010F88D86|nr:phosphatase PAP2 family protein [Enterococcus xiangfangensis]MBM7712687.1 undecaprenyl-diphosphatase [Enterococcus xiangfangensis]NBK09828.1 PAP2 family protein [Enterococcus asini]
MKNKSLYQLIGSFTLLFFAALCYIVRFYPETLAGFDRGIIQAVHQLYPQLNGYFLWVTKFANPTTIVLLTLVFTGLFYFNKQKITALWLVTTMALVSGVGNHLLKLFFQRERPTLLPHMVVEHSFSFPSGHSTASTLLYGTLIAVMALFFKEKTPRLIAQLIAGLLIFSIMISRIYLGVHYPSDVLGGMLFGSSWLLFTYPYYKQKKLAYDLKAIRRNR